MFHVGQLVECVDDRPNIAGRPTVLRLRQVYTVRKVMMEIGVSVWGEDYGVLLYECDPDEGMAGFAPQRFRPLTDSRLAVFRKLLAPSPKHEREPA